MKRVRELDRDLRQITCQVCGRPLAGVVPAGQTAEEAGLCTGKHSLNLGGPRNEWWRRFDRAQDRLRALDEGGAEETILRRIERYLRWARSAYVVATVHAAGPERVERESRRAWRWLCAAETELADCGQGEE